MTLLTKGLIDAARQDRPLADQRSRIWDAVASAPGISVAATGTVGVGATVGASKTLGLSAGKLVLLGALVGSVATAAFGVLAIRATHVNRQSPVALAARVVVPRPLVGDSAEKTALVVAPPADPIPLPSTLSRSMSTSMPTSMSARNVPEPEQTAPPARPVARSAGSSDDSLMREAELVNQARTQMVQGQASSALQLLDAADRGSSHNLEPESLALRVRALRALGRDAEAERAEGLLQHRYPDHFLAR